MRPFKTNSAWEVFLYLYNETYFVLLTEPGLEVMKENMTPDFLNNKPSDLTKLPHGQGGQKPFHVHCKMAKANDEEIRCLLVSILQNLMI